MGFSISKKIQLIEDVTSGVYIVMFNGNPESGGEEINSTLTGDSAGIFFDSFTTPSESGGEVSTENDSEVELVDNSNDNSTITHLAFYSDPGLQNLDWVDEVNPGGGGYQVNENDRVFISQGNLKFTIT